MKNFSALVSAICLAIFLYGLRTTSQIKFLNVNEKLFLIFKSSKTKDFVKIYLG